MFYTKVLSIVYLALTTSTIDIDKQDKITFEDLQATEHSVETDAKASIMDQDVKVKVIYDTSKEEWLTEIQVFKRLKIYDNSESDRSNIIIPYYKNNNVSEKVSSIKGVTYNLNDSKVSKSQLSKKNIFDEETSKYYSQKKIAMPNVKAGSIIDIEYKITSPLLRIPRRFVQFDIPCDKSVYQVEVPEYFHYNTSTTGYVPMDVDEDEGHDRIQFSQTTRTAGISVKSEIHNETLKFKTKIKTFRATNTPSLNHEPLVRNMDNYRGSIKYELASYRSPSGEVQQFLKSWDHIAQRLNENSDFGKFLTTNKKDLEKVVSQVNSLEKPQKIQQLYSYVQSNYRWNKYNGVVSEEGLNNFLKTKTGNVADINLLLVKLLRMAGVNAHPVAGRSSFSGFLNFYYPSVDDLNYVMASVLNDDNTVLLMDATSGYHYIGSLPERALNQKAVIVSSNNRGLPIDISNPNTGKSVILAKASYDVDEGLVVNCKTKTSKYDGLQMYEEKASYNSEQEWLSAIESRFNDRYFENSEVKYGDHISKGATITHDYVDELGAEEIGDKIYLKADLALAPNNHLYKAESRDFPLFFESAQTKQYTVQFEIPEGYTLESQPDDLSVGLPDKMFSYNYSIKQQENRLIIQIIQARRSSVIPPDYYSALKEVSDQIISKQNEKIVLAKI